MERTYKVAYKFYKYDTTRYTNVRAKSKAEAYDREGNAKVPNAYNGSFPYSAWVVQVRYANGRVHMFNTSEAMAY